MSDNYVYACVYSEDKLSFLVPRKKQYGYFFQWRPVPQQILNFSGQDVLPGGGLKSHQTPEQGALTEFLEETGVDITHLATLRGVSEFDYEYNGVKGKYYGVYFTVSDLVSLQKSINTNLEMDVAEKIKHVEDDELNNIEIYSAGTAARMLQTFDAKQAAPGYKGQQDKSWFIDILKKLP